MICKILLKNIDERFRLDILGVYLRIQNIKMERREIVSEGGDWS
jgi:hypothetical protein